MRVVVVGSSNTDLVIHSPRLPRVGETILGGDFRQDAGGKGANQAVAAARAGAEVTFVGAHGPDAFGAAAKKALKAEGIDVRHFNVKAGCSSGVALICVGGKERENMIVVARSANDRLSVTDVRAAEKSIRGADVVVSQLEVPLVAVIAAAELARKHGVRFLLNPAPVRSLPRRLLGYVHTLIANDTEAEMLAKQGDVARNADELLRRGCAQIIVTRGKKGAILKTAERAAVVRPRKVNAVDTVGAGDCFIGWYAAGLAGGMEVIAAAKRAAEAAAICVTRIGAQAAMPYHHELGPSWH